jgi:hypothetical protein
VGGGDITMPPLMFQDHSVRHADKQTCSNMCSSILVTFSFPDRILRLTRDRPAGGGGSLQFPQRMSSFKLLALTKAPCLTHLWQFYIYFYINQLRLCKCSAVLPRNVPMSWSFVIKVLVFLGPDQTVLTLCYVRLG